MNLRKLTLSYPPETELLFRVKYFKDSILQFRISFLLVTIVYMAFGLLDDRINKDLTSLFHLIRYAIVFPSLFSVFLFSFHPIFKKIWQETTFLVLVAVGFCTAILTLLAADNYVYYAGMTLVFATGYFFIKLCFYLATMAGLLILIFFDLLALTILPIDSEMLLINNFFFVAINLIGIFAAYNLEKYTRKDFFLNQQLDRRNAEIFEANRNLELKVEARTRELLVAKELSEQSDKLKSAFLANMSHEIRTPMNGILGFTQLLKEPNLTGEQQQEYIRIIQKSGNRMLYTINNIVDISRIEAGMMKVNLSNTNINEKTNFVYEFFKPEAEAKGLRFSHTNALSYDQAMIHTDGEKLYAILFNLVKNAIKYTNTGSVEFGYIVSEKLHATSLTRPQLEFYVSDTGIGIPGERQEAVFERFIQADIADVAAYQGAGLGLSLSKAYVEMLGGTISIESMVGKGSKFHFTIPYALFTKTAKTDNHQTKTEPPSESNISTVKPLQILIADDDDLSVLYLQNALKRVSTNILTVATGAGAIEVCQNNPDIDLVLMDIKMPELNGYDATRMIRQFNKDIVIIAQTAFALTGDREKSIDAGCNDYITKPIKPDHLLTLIQKYFAN